MKYDLNIMIERMLQQDIKVKASKSISPETLQVLLNKIKDAK